MIYLKKYETFTFEEDWEEINPIDPSIIGKLHKDLNIRILKGQILSDIKKTHNEIIFTTNNNIKYLMIHEQDCCEDVVIEDINGDLNDLIGSPIINAYEETNDGYLNDDTDEGDTFTWTFYNISTIKGTVIIRWYGVSNGYYSESVSFIRIN